MFSRLFNFETRADRAKAFLAWSLFAVPAIAFWFSLLLWALFFSAGGWKEHRNIFFFFSFLGITLAAGNAGWIVVNLYFYIKLKMIIKSHQPQERQSDIQPTPTVDVPVYVPRPDGSGWSDRTTETHTIESAKALTIKHPPRSMAELGDYCKRFKGLGDEYSGWIFRTYANAARKSERESKKLTSNSPSPVVDFME